MRFIYDFFQSFSENMWHIKLLVKSDEYVTVSFTDDKSQNYKDVPERSCAEHGFLDSCSASVCKVFTPAPGVTPDLRKLIDSYS